MPDSKTGLDTNQIIAIVAIIVTILVPLTIWIYKRMFVGSELTIHLEKTGSQSVQRGYSNDQVVVDGVIDARTAKRIFLLKWEFDLIITNNSDHTAYYPSIKFKDDRNPFFSLDRLNHLKPISSKESIVLSGVYQELEEATGDGRTNIGTVAIPTSINNVEILLEYSNSSKAKFYTVYKNKDQVNTFHKVKPKGFIVI
ncbi:hypothetical protein [Pedobacter panaciterrae]